MKRVIEYRRKLSKVMRRDLTTQEREEMATAHAQGLHDELPREGCPECPTRQGARQRRGK